MGYLDHRLIGASVSHNLTLSLGKGYKSQEINLKAYNDFSKFDFPIKITAKNEDDDSEESTIVIIIIVLCAIVFVFFLFYIFSIAKKKKPTEERESLLTEN